MKGLQALTLRVISCVCQRWGQNAATRVGVWVGGNTADEVVGQSRCDPHSLQAADVTFGSLVFLPKLSGPQWKAIEVPW